MRLRRLGPQRRFDPFQLGRSSNELNRCNRATARDVLETVIRHQGRFPATEEGLTRVGRDLLPASLPHNVDVLTAASHQPAVFDAGQLGTITEEAEFPVRDALNEATGVKLEKR